MLYRIKQFIWAVVSSFKRIDMEYIKKYLTEDDMKLFFRLKKNEQQHSIRVAKLCEKEAFKYDNIETDRLIRIALLHDIGKCKIHLNIIDKSILVIMNKITKGAMKKHTNIKKIDVYYNHGAYGGQILQKLGYDSDIVYIVSNHHNKDDGRNIMMNILKKCDDMS